MYQISIRLAKIQESVNDVISLIIVGSSITISIEFPILVSFWCIWLTYLFTESCIAKNQFTRISVKAEKIISFLWISRTLKDAVRDFEYKDFSKKRCNRYEDLNSLHLSSNSYERDRNVSNLDQSLVLDAVVFRNCLYLLTLMLTIRECHIRKVLYCWATCSPGIFYSSHL